MPNAAEAQGAQGRMMLSTSTDFSAGLWCEFLSESITITEERVNSAGIRGTRSHASERTRAGRVRVGGQIQFEASRLLLDRLLPAALGTAESSNVFDVAETLPDLYLLIDKRTDIVRINEAKIGRIEFSGRQGEPLRVTVDIEAESATTGQTWPESVYPERSLPYLFTDLGDVTIEGESRDPAEVRVTVDNALDAETYLNSRYRDETITATDRIVTASVTVLAETANADLAATTTTGVAVSLVFTHAEEASSVLTIALGRVSFAPATPVIDGKGTKLMRLEGQSRALKHPGESGHVPDIKITNAHA